jgi:DNA-binding MarR family transcriptional regulator
LTESGYPEIRRSHSAVLRTISPDGSRIVDLAAAAQMRKQSMGDLVSYLEEHGYVRLKNDPNDARARLAFLTEKGEKLHRRAMEISKEVEEEVASRIGAANVRQLRSFLEAMSNSDGKSR